MCLTVCDEGRVHRRRVLLVAFSLCRGLEEAALLESFNKKKRKEADMTVRNFLYHDTSFNIAKSPFDQPIVDAFVGTQPRCKAPSYSALREEKLDEELECVKA